MTLSDEKKISFLEAAVTLERICDQVTELEQVGPLCLALLSDAKEDLKSATDRKIGYRQYLESQIAHAKIIRDKWADRIRTLEKIKEWVDARTVEVLLTLPNLRFKGDRGELKLQDNSQPSVVLTDDSVAQYKGKYFKWTEELAVVGKYMVEWYRLDFEQMKKDMEAGQELPFARLERGKHLRVIP